jgi:hypothetical protein
VLLETFDWTRGSPVAVIHVVLVGADAGIDGPLLKPSRLESGVRRIDLICP